MAKRNLNKFLEECIEGCWLAQKTELDDQSETYKALSAKVEAFQEVYAHLNDGDEYDGSSEVLDEAGPGIDEPVEEEKPQPDADDEEEDGDEDTDDDE